MKVLLLKMVELEILMKILMINILRYSYKKNLGILTEMLQSEVSEEVNSYGEILYTIMSRTSKKSLLKTPWEELNSLILIF